MGFAFVGNQVHLEVDGEDFYLDMLFLSPASSLLCRRRLKATSFRPEYAGKLQFYLSAVDDLIRDSQKDGPTIGLLLAQEQEAGYRRVHVARGQAPHRRRQPSALPLAARILPRICLPLMRWKPS